MHASAAVFSFNTKHNIQDRAMWEDAILLARQHWLHLLRQIGQAKAAADRSAAFQQQVQSMVYVHIVYIYAQPFDLVSMCPAIHLE